MNLVEKASAVGIALITGTFGLLTAISSSSQNEELTAHIVSQEEAYETCGGRADLRTTGEEVGDGTIAVFEVYRCPDGREIPVIDWR